MRTVYSTFLYIFILTFSLTGSAQKVIKVNGKSQVRIENNMTREQALEKAEDLAIINAIENSFGTYVEQISDISVKEGAVSYNIIGSTKVKGEWLGLKSIEFKDEIHEQVAGNKSKEKIPWISCTIEGLACEIRPKATLQANTLLCPSPECKSFAFTDSQSLYLYFNSPIDGYLSVFIDEDNETTRRLFPYLNQGNESAVKIKGDEPYILFSNAKDMNKFEVRADEIELFTYRSLEYNNIYVVFSPIPYCKPILSGAVLLNDGYTLPKAISTGKFQEWLTECRVAMPDFQAKRIKISIEKK
jgi:hypothetical protein